MIYGILKSIVKDTPKEEICGTAVLGGRMLGKTIEHSAPFRFQPTELHSLPIIHHLAAKALIKDWQEYGHMKVAPWQVMGKDSKEIVQLSIESGVISSHTAFIAVDEESSEPVTGTMKMWDIRTQFDWRTRLPRSEDLEHQSTKLSSSAATFSKPTKAAEKSLEFFSSLSSWTFDYSSSSSSSTPLPILLELNPAGMCRSLRTAIAGSIMVPATYACSEGVTLEIGSSEDISAGIEDAPEMSCPRSQFLTSHDAITAVVAKQQVDGSWKLDATLAQLLAKDQKVLQDGCPMQYQDATAATMCTWATVLVLTKLRLSYSSQQEEWELIAMKAESWLRRQQLPAGTTLEDMHKAAENLLA